MDYSDECSEAELSSVEQRMFSVPNRASSPCAVCDESNIYSNVEMLPTNRTRSTRTRPGTISGTIFPDKPPPVQRELDISIERPGDRLETLFERGKQANEIIQRLTNSLDAPSEIKRVKELIDGICRLAAQYCEECAVQVTCMRQTIAEELVDLDVYATRVLEWQRVLEATGHGSESVLIERSSAAVERIGNSLSMLHPHESFTYPMRSSANGNILKRGRNSIS